LKLSTNTDQMSSFDGNGLPAPKQLTPGTPDADWKHEDRAWPPSLDYFMGDPKQLCHCGHERQTHVRNGLEGRHRECQGSPAGCTCRSFLSLASVEAGKAVHVYLVKEGIYLDERQSEQVARAIESVMPFENDQALPLAGQTTETNV